MGASATCSPPSAACMLSILNSKSSTDLMADAVFRARTRQAVGAGTSPKPGSAPQVFDPETLRLLTWLSRLRLPRTMRCLHIRYIRQLKGVAGHRRRREDSSPSKLRAR